MTTDSGCPNSTQDPFADYIINPNVGSVKGNTIAFGSEYSQFHDSLGNYSTKDVSAYSNPDVSTIAPVMFGTLGVSTQALGT